MEVKYFHGSYVRISGLEFTAALDSHCDCIGE